MVAAPALLNTVRLDVLVRVFDGDARAWEAYLASTEHVQQQQEDAQFVQALVRRVGADPAFAVTMRRVHDQLEHLFDNL